MSGETQEQQNPAHIEASRKLNPAERLLGCLITPGETMKNIAEWPGYVVPAVMVALTPVIPVALNRTAYTDFQTEAAGKAALKLGQNIPAEELRRSIENNYLQTLIASPVAALLGWVLGTALLFGILKAFSARGKYKQMLAVTGYSQLPALLGMIIGGSVMAATHLYDPNISYTNLAALIPGISGTFWGGFFRTFDIFVLWQYGLIAIGAAAVTGLSRKITISISAGVFLFIAIFAGAGELVTKAFLG